MLRLGMDLPLISQPRVIISSSWIFQGMDAASTALQARTITWSIMFRMSSLSWMCWAGKKPVIFLAHCMGAAVTTFLASSFPDRVHSVILVEGLGPNPPRSCAVNIEEVPQDLKRYFSEYVTYKGKKPFLYSSLESAARRMVSNNPTMRPQSAMRLVTRGTQPISEVLDSQGSVASNEKDRLSITDFKTDVTVIKGLIPPEMGSSPIDNQTNIQATGVVFRHDIRLRSGLTPVKLTEQQVHAFLKKIRQPVLCLLGSVGNPPLLKVLEERKKHIGNLELHIIEGGGHHFHLDMPETIEESIFSFLDKYPITSKST